MEFLITVSRFHRKTPCIKPPLQTWPRPEGPSQLLVHTELDGRSILVCMTCIGLKAEMIQAQDKRACLARLTLTPVRSQPIPPPYPRYLSSYPHRTPISRLLICVATCTMSSLPSRGIKLSRSVRSAFAPPYVLYPDPDPKQRLMCV